MPADQLRRNVPDRKRRLPVAVLLALGLGVTATACNGDDENVPDTESPLITDPEGVIRELDEETNYEEEYEQFDPEREPEVGG